MAIRRAKIASVTDSAEPTLIQPSDLDPETLPPSPADGDIWTQRTGTSPNRFIRIHIYDAGAWRMVGEHQY